MIDVATRSSTATGRFVVGTVGLVIALGCCSAPSWSQGTTPSPAAPVAAPRAPAAIEPRVDTPAPTGAITAPSSAPRAVPAGAAAGTTGARPSSAPPSPAAAAVRRGGRAMDRVDLEASQITGNRELPRVLYIVPWRAPSAGDIEGRPVNSLLFELTKPVDRDVFRRENRYFDALQATATATAGGAPAAGESPAPGATGGGPEK